MAVLSSDWTGLSSHLLASIYPVQMDAGGGSRKFARSGDDQVVGPVTDGSLEQAVNWQSPFEGMTPDAGLGTFGSMLQVGGLIPVINAMQKQAGGNNEGLAKASKAAASMVGASSVTKLNSTQAFNGAPPLQINLTMLFRALLDPIAEVEQPINQLMEWLLPIELAENGALANLINADMGLVRSIFPSRAPTAVAFVHGGVSYSPMVIESLSVPITAPRDRNGNRTHAQVQLRLASLSAIDRSDWRSWRGA